MRNISKTATLEHKFPLLAIEEACVLSKEADISIGFKIALPELFTISSNDYDNLHSIWLKPSKYYPTFVSFINKISLLKKTTSQKIFKRKN